MGAVAAVMRRLSYKDVIDFCGDPDAREAWWGDAEGDPPYVLPLFDVCRAIFRVSSGTAGLDAARFRQCWRDAVERHASAMVSGNVLRCVSEGSLPGHNLAREVWRRGRPEMLEEVDATIGADPRATRGAIEPRHTMSCFGELNDLAFERVRGELEALRARQQACWEGMEELPNKTHTRVSGDLVLDTNFFVDLLEEMGGRGHDSTRPWCTASRARQVLCSQRQRLVDALTTGGRSGKLIVPTVVLIETYGVVRRGTRSSYPNALRVMNEIEALGDGWRHAASFRFYDEDPIQVVDAFLALVEAVQYAVDRGRWSITDALVLAHGLREGCPVISGEWVDKTDWAPVAAHFPWLKP